MKFDFHKGQRLILELSDKNVFEGNYESGTAERIDLVNIVDLETRDRVHGRLTFYRHEIISAKLLESDINVTVSNDISKSPEKTSNVIALPRAEYERLQDMTQNYIYFATADRRYVDAISHLNSCENIGVVGVGFNFGPTKPINLLVMCSWDQVYIFDVLSYQYSNFPSDLKEILESSHIKKIGHGLLKLVQSLWYCHNVRVDNIFDTQLADLEIEQKKLEDKKGVELIKERCLSECLKNYLNFPSSVLNEAEDITSNIWKERELSNSTKVKAALLVVYLITLKNKLERLMLQEFYDKIDICLKDTYQHTSYQGCVKLNSNGIRNGFKNMRIK